MESSIKLTLLSYFLNVSVESFWLNSNGHQESIQFEVDTLHADRNMRDELLMNYLVATTYIRCSGEIKDRNKTYLLPTEHFPSLVREKPCISISIP